MKVLAVASTMDLALKLGCTPSWWQLWKALHETGHQVIVTPYLGDPVEALWWRTYPNPCRTESALFNKYLASRKASGKSPSRKTALSPLFRKVIELRIRPRWMKHLQHIITEERDIDVLLFMNVPINHITGIPLSISEEYGIPVVFYDGDMPSALPDHAVQRGLRFSYYEGADLSEFDLFLVNSEAVIPRIKQMGAKRVSPFHYAIDPDLFTPLIVPRKQTDVAYYALSSTAREAWIRDMITIPSLKLEHRTFRVAGGRFDVDLGNAMHGGDLTYSEYRRFCCTSSINLNITSWTHATARGTSTSRPFELAAFGCCIVSQPYDGIELWFKPEKEIAIVHSADEASALYEELLSHPEVASALGTRARERVLSDHTYRQRAVQLTRLIDDT